MKNKISASMMCSDLLHINETIKIFEKLNIDYLHIDVMDGSFVPNFGLGIDYINSLRNITKIPFDIHLMIDNPENKLSYFDIRKDDIVSIHYESSKQVHYALDQLEKYKCKRFLAISPATPIYVVEEVMDIIDGINLLMVNPGFAGQKMLPNSMEKAIKLNDYIIKYVEKKEDFGFEVDGNITFDNAQKLKNIGANIFVAGSSSIFDNHFESLENNINELYRRIL